MGVTAGPARTGSSTPSGGGTQEEAGETFAGFDLDAHEGRLAYYAARLGGELGAPPARGKVVVSDDEVKALMYRAMPVPRRSQEQRDAQAAKDEARAEPGRRAGRDYELLVVSQHAAPPTVGRTGIAPRVQSRPRERRGPSRSTRRATSAASSGSGSSDSDPPAGVAVSASLAGVA